MKKLIVEKSMVLYLSQKNSIQIVIPEFERGLWLEGQGVQLAV